MTSAIAVDENCPVCASSDTTPFRTGITHRHYPIPGSFATRRCADCELEWLSPQPSEAEIASFYPSDYYAHSGPSRRSLWSRIVAKLGADVRSIEPDFEAPGKMLDIGCGTGAALKLYEAKGWTAVGVNFSGSPEEFRQRVLIGRFSEIDFGDEKFDYVRLNHTLEHLPDPAPTIAKIAGLVQQGGKVFIAVPNARSWAYRLFGTSWWNYGVPCHLFVFDRKSLVHMLERNGFRVIKVREASDFAAITGSLQIRLNRKNGRPSNSGFVFQSKPLRIAAHLFAKFVDLFAHGDCIEITAVKASN